GWRDVAADVAELCAELATAVHGSLCFVSQGQELDLSLPWPELAVCEAMQKYAGVALRGDESVAELIAALRAAGHPAKELDSQGQPLGWDDLFFAVFLDHVEPRLKSSRPVVLYD